MHTFYPRKKLTYHTLEDHGDSAGYTTCGYVYICSSAYLFYISIQYKYSMHTVVCKVQHAVTILQCIITTQTIVSTIQGPGMEGDAAHQHNVLINNFFYVVFQMIAPG